MPRKSISFELDFMIKDIFPRFTVKQFDDVSFNIKPKNQGLDYNTTGMIGKIFVGVNNDVFMQTTGITVSNNNINILLDKNMLQKSGRAYAEVELTDNAGTITSSSFIFDIDPKIGEGGMIPGEYEGFVEKYERLISEFKSQVNSCVNNANTLVNKTINNCNTNVDNKLNTVDGLINTKVLDFEKRFNSLTSKQQQDAEVIDARAGAVSLKARLDNFDSQLEQKVNYIEIEKSEFDLLDSNIIGESILFNLDNGLQWRKVWGSSIKQFVHHDTRNSTPILVAQPSQKYNFLINNYEANSKLPTCLQLDENLNEIAVNSWVRSTTTAQNCKYIIVNCEFADSIKISKAGE